MATTNLVLDEKDVAAAALKVQKWKATLPFNGFLCKPTDDVLMASFQDCHDLFSLTQTMYSSTRVSSYDCTIWDLRSFSQPLRNVPNVPNLLSELKSPLWNRAVEDLGPNAPQTVENFDEAIQNFVGAHTGTQDRHALVQQLIHPTKPRDLGVQAFYYRLLELNDAISLIPGAAHDAPLNDEQLKQAFYDGMPAIWRERFVKSGSRLTEMARAEVIRYFRDQERQALTRQRNQDAHPRRFKTKKRPPTESAKPTSSKSSYGSKFSKQSHQHKRQKGHVANDAPCPVHPGSGHTWSDCRANHFGKHYKTNPTSTQPPKNKSDKPTDGYVAEVVSNPYVDCPNSAFSRAAEDCFALGIDNPQIHIDINQSLDNQLGQQLSPVMIALVDDIQHHPCRRSLKALCDSGSALTMIHPESIPPGAVPHKLPKPIRLMTAGGIVELHYGVKLTGLR
ncbi:hypothetical protein IV203_036766 [Nitzschia inconspicua]|uniref:Uncharacterized protein n=1 Tax=Nitzschia inconspicua TaxID=303405 RepID=A0A9K3LGY4_9STRA|nr:hypothetical protein IV203_036766 [Nitzschia inconspicua]